MSSFDARGIRPASNDPLLQIFVELQKQVVKSIRDGQVGLVDSDNEDIFSDGQDIDTAIKYHSELSSTHKFNFNIDYYPPFEPDNNKVKLMLKGWNTGNTINDESGYNHPAKINGDPTLIDGTMDLGIWNGPSSIKSIALRMNRPTSSLQNQEYLGVAFPTSQIIEIADLVIGMSIFIRFRVKTIANQGGISLTLFEKIDDASPNSGYMLQIRDDGSLLFVTKQDGVQTAKITATGVIAPDVIYDVFATYAFTGPVLHVYVNGIDKTLSTFGGSVNWQTDTSVQDLNIFRRGEGTDGGYIYGDFYMYTHYREKVVSQTEVTQHYANKWTISNIPFGHVMITGYWATYQDASGLLNIPSFDSVSFDSTSFTTDLNDSFTPDSFTDISFS